MKNMDTEEEFPRVIFDDEEDCISRRIKFVSGEIRYFISDGWGASLNYAYESRNTAITSLREDEEAGLCIGQQIEIMSRKFLGIYKAAITFGKPNNHGARKACKWGWKSVPPTEASYFEKCSAEECNTYGHSSGRDIGGLLLGEYAYDFDKQSETAEVSVACWADLDAARYQVELQPLAPQTDDRTNASLDATGT